jgi:hypothetical protein
MMETLVQPFEAAVPVASITSVVPEGDVFL